VFKWHKYFTQGNDNSEDELTGQPRMLRTELKIQEAAMLVYVNRSKVVKEVAAAGINHGTCHKIQIT
jgi:hypothetical protein